MPPSSTFAKRRTHHDLHFSKTLITTTLYAVALVSLCQGFSFAEIPSPTQTSLEQKEPQLDELPTQSELANPKSSKKSRKKEAKGDAAGPETGLASGEPVKAKAVIVDIDSETLNYSKEKDLYTATGAVHVVISEQNSELLADKVIYDQNKEVLVAEGHVRITKNGQTTEGTYAKIDLTHRSALVNDAQTAIEAVRVKSKTALIDPEYVQLENGKLIIDKKTLATVMSNSRDRRRGNRLQNSFGNDLFEDPNNVSDFARGNGAAKGQLDTEALNLASANTPPSPFHLKAKEIDIVRNEGSYDKIELKWPSLYWNKFKIATAPSTEFSYDEETKQVEYLGPDIGYDRNLGGFYYGPGWDFKLGDGIMKISPIASYGTAARRKNKGAELDDKGAGLGFGGVAHYRDKNTRLDLGYNSRFGDSVVFGERKIFTPHTKLLIAHNTGYANGFISGERPGYIAQISDSRVVKEFKNMELSTFASMGVARDEFFPNNTSTVFVTAQDKGVSTPTVAGRVQIQAQIQNQKPIFEIGKAVDFGFLGQVALSGYSTGDFLGIVRAGPTMDIELGERFKSYVTYLMGTDAGDTPFVFDSYYQGKQNVQIHNAFKVNKYLTVGTINNLSLLKDNSRDALAVGNALYFMVGPQDVKFNMGFDFIRKRSFFGINFYPGSGSSEIEFDQLRMFQPMDYTR